MTLTREKKTPIYMTTGGAQRLRAELKELLYTLRPEMVKTAAWAASNGDRSENADYHYAKRCLRKYDGRIRFLSKRLEEAEVVDPVAQEKVAGGRALFGATVTVENCAGTEKTYAIVGVDEYNPACGHVSWTSPIGKALLGKEISDEVIFQSPGGRVELEIISIVYRSLMG